MDLGPCTNTLRPPDCPPGTEFREGRFIRNLEKDAVTKRYDKDKEPPQFGYKVRPEKWTWARHDWQGLSVNLATCVNERLLCSFLLHKEPDRFRHAVVIDLQALSEQLGIELIASYAPVEAPPNPCHFNIMPAEGSMADLLQRLREYLGFTFPSKLPNDADACRQAMEAKEQYERVFRIERNVRS